MISSCSLFFSFSSSMRICICCLAPFIRYWTSDDGAKALTVLFVCFSLLLPISVVATFSLFCSKRSCSCIFGNHVFFYVDFLFVRYLLAIRVIFTAPSVVNFTAMLRLDIKLWFNIYSTSQWNPFQDRWAACALLSFSFSFFCLHSFHQNMLSIIHCERGMWMLQCVSFFPFTCVIYSDYLN